MKPPKGGWAKGINEECEFIDLEECICTYIDVLKMRPALDGNCRCPGCRSALLEMRGKKLFKTAEKGN